MRHGKQVAGKRKTSKLQNAARLERSKKWQSIQIKAGYAVIGATILASMVMALLGQVNPALVVALVLLAGFRLLVLRKEAKRASEETNS